MRISRYFLSFPGGRLATAAVTVTALTLLTGTAAMATQRYVANTGTDNASCTPQANACAHIQQAVMVSMAGDTINVAAGLYNEQVQVTQTLTFLGAQAGVDARTRSGAESIITNTCGPVQIMADQVVLNGFTIEGATSTAGQCFFSGIWSNPGYSGTHGGHQILNNIVQNNISGIELDSDGTFPALLQFNLIQNNNNPGAGSGNGIITSFGLYNTKIDSNNFVSNTNAGLSLQAGGSNLTISNNSLTSNGDGMDLFSVQSSSITNNTINSSTGTAIGVDGGDSGLTITNNSLNAGPYGVQVVNPYGIGSDSSLTIQQNNITNFTTAGLFVDPAAYGGSVPATCNWWGNASGPMNPGNPHGTGNAVSGPATFIPWLVGTAGSPSGTCSGGLPPSSIPSSGICNGTYNQPFNGNVTVPSGDTCVLVSSSVGGNITVQGTGTLTCVNEAVYGTINLTGSGGTLNFTGGSIDSQGNNFSVLATNPAAVNLYNTSTNYTVEVNGSGGANPQGVDIEGTHIDGSLVTNSAYSVLVVNNSIVEQNAEFFTTTHVPSHFTTSMRNTLCNITIGGNLEIESNTAAFGIGAGNGCAAPPSSGSVHVDAAAIVTGNNVAAPPPTPSSGSVTIDMNYINAGLSCSSNTPAPSESAPKNNTVGGGATGQCAGFGK